MLLLSGGQTGVDRAALDAALDAGVPVGGWCPAGRWAEDSPIPAHYPLREATSADPAERTRLNVCDADAVLLLAPGQLAGGTHLTAENARELDRPLLVLDPFPDDSLIAAEWCRSWARLDVAGPRQSEAPGIYEAARRFLDAMLRALVNPST